MNASLFYLLILYLFYLIIKCAVSVDFIYVQACGCEGREIILFLLLAK